MISCFLGTSLKKRMRGGGGENKLRQISFTKLSLTTLSALNTIFEAGVKKQMSWCLRNRRSFCFGQNDM